MSTPPNILNIADYKNKFVIFEVNTSREKMHVFERNVRILDVSAEVKSDGTHRILLIETAVIVNVINISMDVQVTSVAVSS